LTPTEGSEGGTLQRKGDKRNHSQGSKTLKIPASLTQKRSGKENTENTRREKRTFSFWQRLRWKDEENSPRCPSQRKNIFEIWGVGREGTLVVSTRAR